MSHLDHQGLLFIDGSRDDDDGDGEEVDDLFEQISAKVYRLLPGIKRFKKVCLTVSFSFH